MAKLLLQAMLAGVSVTPKTDFNTKAPVVDSQTGAPVFNRITTMVDLDSEKGDAYKINFTVEQHEMLEAAKHTMILVECSTRLYNGKTYFDLVNFKPLKSAA